MLPVNFIMHEYVHKYNVTPRLVSRLVVVVIYYRVRYRQRQCPAVALAPGMGLPLQAETDAHFNHLYWYLMASHPAHRATH